MHLLLEKDLANENFIFRMRASSCLASSFSSPWPDPNSPVLSKIDFGVPIVELLKWLDVRDTLLGDNFKKQDIKKALAQARECKHPDAVWLTSLFEGKEVSTKDQAKKVFLSQQNDARALCFAWWLIDNRRMDLTLLRRAAEIGKNAFSWSTLCWQVWLPHNDEAHHLAQFSSAHLERDGFFWVGHCYCYGFGLEKDLNLAKETYLIASELGSVRAALKYGELQSQSNPARWIWWGRAALSGFPDLFLDALSKQVEEYCSGAGNATIVFLIGRALKGNIDLEKKEIFGLRLYINDLIGRANQAVSFYESQIKCARLAVDTWTLLSTRLNVVKDMRVSIGKMIWEARFEANYQVIHAQHIPMQQPVDVQVKIQNASWCLLQ